MHNWSSESAPRAGQKLNEDTEHHPRPMSEACAAQFRAKVSPGYSNLSSGLHGCGRPIPARCLSRGIPGLLEPIPERYGYVNVLNGRRRWRRRFP